MGRRRPPSVAFTSGRTGLFIRRPIVTPCLSASRSIRIEQSLSGRNFRPSPTVSVKMGHGPARVKRGARQVMPPLLRRWATNRTAQTVRRSH